MNNLKISYLNRGAVLFMLACFCLSCKKLVTVEPPVTSLNDRTVYASDADATSVLTNLYINMSQSGIRGGTSLMSLSLYAGLSSDELSLYPDVFEPAMVAHYENDLSATTPGIPNYWSGCYNFIYVANSAIDGLKASTTLTPAVKSQLLGEAFFMRAFCYFYLVNLYGDVPLNLTTDHQENGKRPRTAIPVVYKQIIEDLKEAQSLLRPDYINSKHILSNERVRPNQFSATALLARAYLYSEDYANAEVEASKVIANNILYKIEGTENTFLKASKETIWAIQPVTTFGSTSDAIFFKPDQVDLSAPAYGFQIQLNSEFINQMDPIDKRKLEWVGNVELLGNNYYYANKYKNDDISSSATEYTIVLRLAEQYLIRAEARAKLGRISGANSAEGDLNVIRTRAGLSPTDAIDNQTEMLGAILTERKRELFTEWGHRWFDLKRTGNADSILGPFKGSHWQTTDQLYPIPQQELDRNPGIRGHQNP